MTYRAAPVCVIVPTFNRAATLPDAINSILNQTVKPDQVIVVNDGSSDETGQIVLPFLDRVTYIDKDNGGKCSAINAALEQADQEFVWVFDDDDVACEDAIERHLAVLQRRPEIGFTISGSYRCREEPETGRLVVIRAHGVRDFHDDDYLLELMLSSYIAGPSTMIRRSLIEQVGPYRTDLARVDDFEMALRLGLVSRPGRLDDPKPTYYRRWHRGLRGWQDQRFGYDESIAHSREEERMVLRDMHGRIELRHYLPRSDWDKPFDRATERSARLRRWVVSVQKHLWPEAGEEFEALRDLGLASLSLCDLVWAQRAFSDLNALSELRGDEDALRQLREGLSDPSARRLRLSALKQFYYHLRASLNKREWQRIEVAAAVGRGIFDIRGILDALMAR